MRDSNSNAVLIPSDFFVLRTPLLPLEELVAMGKHLQAPHALKDSAHLEHALREDRHHLRMHLRTLVTRPEIREALFLASHDLKDAIERWLSLPDSQKGQRAERTLLRYITRMAARP